MKKSKIIIFSTALVLLLFANISVTLFDGSENEININLNKTEVLAYGGGSGSSVGSGSGDDYHHVACSYNDLYCALCDGSYWFNYRGLGTYCN
jgi:hypothetical protein